MPVKQQLETALHEAMKSGNDLYKRTIRMALAAIKLAEVEQRGALDDAVVITLLQKEIKSRREAIQDAEKAQRPDLIAASQQEIGVLETFLPQAMPEEELKALIQAAIQEVGASAPGDMGKVMKAVLPRVQGRAANDQVSKLVKTLLQG